MTQLKIYLLVLPFIFLFYACTPFITSTKAHELVDVYHEGKYEKVILMADRFIAKNPLDHNSWAIKGRAQFMLDRPEEAIQSVSRSIEIYPSNHFAYAYRATFYCITDQLEKALADIEIALQKEPQNLDWLLIRGTCSHDTGKFEKAIEAYEEIIQLNPEDFYANVLLGKSLKKLKKYDQAQNYMNLAIIIDPENPMGHEEMGLLMVEIKQFKKAIESYDNAINRYQDDSPEILIAFTLNNRGYAKWNIKSYADALTDINHSLSILPTNSYAFKNRALVYLSTDKKELACLDLQRALELGFQEDYGNEVAELLAEHC